MPQPWLIQASNGDLHGDFAKPKVAAAIDTPMEGTEGENLEFNQGNENQGIIKPNEENQEEILQLTNKVDKIMTKEQNNEASSCFGPWMIARKLQQRSFNHNKQRYLGGKRNQMDTRESTGT